MEGGELRGLGVQAAGGSFTMGKLAFSVSRLGLYFAAAGSRLP